ncbi:MAG: hypothetical protein WBC36_03860 [Desulfobacterales bacterium]
MASKTPDFERGKAIILTPQYDLPACPGTFTGTYPGDLSPFQGQRRTVHRYHHIVLSQGYKIYTVFLV